MKLTDSEYRAYDRRQVKCIGITGGVGCGKSSVMSYLREKTFCRCFIADDEAKKLYIPGSPVFERIKEAAGDDVIDDNGELIKESFAKKMFKDPDLRAKTDGIVHPAVKGLILDAMAEERISGKHDFFFVEAALLIECGYKESLTSSGMYTHPRIQGGKGLRQTGATAMKKRGRSLLPSCPIKSTENIVTE